MEIDYIIVNELEYCGNEPTFLQDPNEGTLALKRLENPRNNDESLNTQVEITSLSGYDHSFGSVFPNPINITDKLNIKTTEDVDLIEIYTIDGKRLLKLDNLKSKSDIKTIDRDLFSQSGVYIINFLNTSNKLLQSNKIVVTEQ